MHRWIRAKIKRMRTLGIREGEVTIILFPLMMMTRRTLSWKEVAMIMMTIMTQPLNGGNDDSLIQVRQVFPPLPHARPESGDDEDSLLQYRKISPPPPRVRPESLALANSESQQRCNWRKDRVLYISTKIGESSTLYDVPIKVVDMS